MTLEPPVTYQGGKTRIADAIADLLLAELKPNQDVYDLCCGCGAVSIALVKKGLDTRRIHMVDHGPWGLFWERIGCGTFELDYFRDLVDILPKDPRHIRGVLEAFAEKDETDASMKFSVYTFLLLQAGHADEALDLRKTSVVTFPRSVWRRLDREMARLAHQKILRRDDKRVGAKAWRSAVILALVEFALDVRGVY